MARRWDDIEILRMIDERQGQSGGSPIGSMSGRDLMDAIGGPPRVVDDRLIRGFVQELHIARDAGLLTFELTRHADGVPPNPDREPDYYLQQVRNLALTIAGRDRARGRLVVQPPPDPDEDDGRLISQLILDQIARTIEGQYSREQVVVFLEEGGIQLDQLHAPADFQPNGVLDILLALDKWGGSNGRRLLRSFIGRWLDNRLNTGPDDDCRVSLVGQLARQGWHAKEGNLVTGEKMTGPRPNSPILRDARLAVLHSRISEVSAGLLKDGHNAAAVLEAMKAVNNRVKDLATPEIALDGKSLMSATFSLKQPHLILGDLADETGRNLQEGYMYLLMGAMQALRNPGAHRQFEPMDANETLEQLALASLLMRRLDEARPLPADLSARGRAVTPGQ